MRIKDIDVTYDFQTDCREGQDPDSASKTLRSYQQLLWSKPLPNGEMMNLGIEKGFLKWKDMWFGSDSITASFVDFFLLQDCVDDDYNVKFWLNTPLFVSMPMPKDLDEYNKWIHSQLDFVEKRGKRIKEYCANFTHSNISLP